MSLRIGEEFAVKAGSAEWWRMQRYLAETGNEAVIAGSQADRAEAASRRAGATSSTAELMRTLEEQRQQRIADFDTRLEELDRRGDEAVRAAQERFAAVLRDANRAKDGRAVFQDDDGTIYDEQGNVVAADEIDWDNWSAGGPSWDKFNLATGELADAIAFDQKVDEIREGISDKLTDEQLDDLELDLEGLEAHFTSPTVGMLAPANARATSAAKGYLGELDLPGAPPLNAAFASAMTEPTDEAANPSLSPEAPEPFKPV